MKFNAYAFNDDGLPIGRIKDVPLGNVYEFLEMHASDKYDSKDEVARFKVEPVEETEA